MLATPSFSATRPVIHPCFRSDSTVSLSSTRKLHAPIYSTPDNSHLLTSTSTSPEISAPSQPSPNSNAAIKMPTAPWMRGPLYLKPREVVELAKPKDRNFSDVHGDEKHYRVLINNKTDQTGKHAIRNIAKSIGKLQKKDNSEDTQMNLEEREFGDYLEGFAESQESGIRQRMPWEKDERMVLRRIKKKTVGAAEMSLDEVLLERLRGEAAKIGKWVKVMKAGVTQAVVDEIKLIWKRNELAMLKFDVPLCRNMDRAQEIVEMKTGGLVVWIKKNALVVYRGCNHPLPSKLIPQKQAVSSCCPETPLPKQSHMKLNRSTNFSTGESYVRGLNQSIKNSDSELEEASTSFLLERDFHPISGSLYERETDRLLDDLGPRFIDWWMHKPLPVDADMLPEVVPGYMPPFRCCPPFSKQKLTDAELLYLRRLAHPLPTHFVLGRNRKLQGLAAAILKLWERCLIAKIALKWGVPNTNNEQMAYELKNLTGGTLLLRNKFYIILYRGKDFLPVGVANLIRRREMELQRWQCHEEDARMVASGNIYFDNTHMEERAKTGTLSDFKDMIMEFEDLTTESAESKLQLEAEKEKIIKELRTQERQLSIINSKTEISAKMLTKLNASSRHVERDTDREMITNEERESFKKIGLKMESCLLLGRRGIFDGVIEGLHQHWKHRELVKVITMQRAYRQVIYTAKLLEAESGGILISVDKLKEGHAIIIYRGKNYKRPLHSASNTLLTKRKALSRSLEFQRIGSLKFFADQKRRRISELQTQLENLDASGE